MTTAEITRARTLAPVRRAALWVAGGAGYAVRGLAGLALAVELGGRPALVVAAVLAMWALGSVFVTCRWALEAMCFAAFRGESVVWDARRATAREHTLGLVRWLPSTRGAASVADPAHWRALEGRTTLVAPWHLALVVAAAAAAVTGRLLAAEADARTALVAAVVGAVAAAAITRLTGGRGIAALAAAAALAALQGAGGLDAPVAATLPWLVAMLGYACFTRQCAAEIGRPLRRLDPLLRR